MRILHTADWHLGFRLGRHSRRTDTTRALKSLIKHAERTQPHVILHAGDVFHDERPPQSAIEDAVHALKALADYAPVIIAAGNHDGPRLLESLDRLAQEGDPQRITIAARPRTIAVDLTSRNDAPATVVIAAVPWLTRGDGAAAWSEKGRAMNDPERPSHAKWAGIVIRETIEAAHADADSERATANDPPVPVIALIHSHLAGAVASNAEREIAVSREYAVDPNGIPSTAYCACGHIHDRQEITGASADPDRQRPGSVYCGSLIQMTFGEKAQQKTVELVEIQPSTTNNSSPEAKTAWQVAESGQLGLDTERRLIEHNGSWDELAGMARAGRLKDTILKATVNSEDRMHDLAAMVREIEPGIVIHEIRNPVTNPSRIEGQEIAFEDRPEPPIDELYEEWRRDRQTVEREADDGAVELFRTALKAVRAPTEDPFGLKKLEERFEGHRGTPTDQNGLGDSINRFCRETRRPQPERPSRASTGPDLSVQPAKRGLRPPPASTSTTGEPATPGRLNQPPPLGGDVPANPEYTQEGHEMTTPKTSSAPTLRRGRLSMPETETVIAGALTALTGLNGAWLSTSARCLLSIEAFMVLAAGTLVTSAMAARHMRRMLRTTDATAGRTSFTAAVFVILIAVGAWIGRAQAIEVLNQFGD